MRRLLGLGPCDPWWLVVVAPDVLWRHVRQTRSNLRRVR